MIQLFASKEWTRKILQKVFLYKHGYPNNHGTINEQASACCFGMVHEIRSSVQHYFPVSKTCFQNRLKISTSLILPIILLEDHEIRKISISGIWLWISIVLMFLMLLSTENETFIVNNRMNYISYSVFVWKLMSRKWYTFICV